MKRGNGLIKHLCLWVLVILTGQLLAAEFSPALEEELRLKSSDEAVSFIMILESPIDIRALDDRLHAERATLAERHLQVIEALKYNADMTQPQIAAELDDMQKDGTVRGYSAYWIENLFVVQATKDYVEGLRDRGDIRYVTENFGTELIEPVPQRQKPGSERNWDRNPLDNLTMPPGISAIGADRVNTELGVTGQGVLVACLDTGVDGNHPALAARWRGLTEPWQECWMDALDEGTTFPVDNHYHGTHVMGTIAGREISGSDTIWVGCAPDALWIANNAINQNVGGDFDNDIIAAFEWFADPDGDPGTTDDLPDVIQNSWGVNTELGYVQCYDMWNTVVLNCEAAGPVVTWSAGNEGSSGLRSPAIYELNEYQVFSVGAVDATNYSAPYPLAYFSSEGPTPCDPNSGATKPEISAPGVDVYSCEPGGGYQNLSGTSMAGPHVAGVVALMRQACPDCDHQTIKQAIFDTAIDDGYGPTGDDNQFGRGLIDAYNAVMAVSSLGRIGGVITDASTTLPLAGATAKNTAGLQQTTSDADGEYFMALPEDTYTIEYSKFGYTSQTVPGLTVVEGDTTWQHVALQPAPTGLVSGTVTDCYGEPADGAMVEVLDVPVTPAYTNPSGYYEITLPQGTYDMRASGAGCGPQTVTDVTVGASTTQDFTLPYDPAYECSAEDGGGYIACENGDLDGPAYSWYEISPNDGGPGSASGITDDEESVNISLPFTFRLYGADYTSVYVCSNGFLTFTGSYTTYTNEALPYSSFGPAVLPFWDDFDPSSGGDISIYHLEAENAFIIEWNDVPHWNSSIIETFQVWLYDVTTNPGPNGDSQIRFQYQTVAASGSNTIGIQNGTIANSYVFDGSLDANAQGLTDSRVITYGGHSAPEIGTIDGTVTENGSALPLEGVAVQCIGETGNTTTNEFGYYSLNLVPGVYDFEYSLYGYETVIIADVEIEDGVTTTQDVVMTALPVITLLDEDFESGAGDWTHEAPGGWVDNWHLSTERANSGSYSYKCGDTGTGDYDDLCDSRLTSPVLASVPQDAFLSFVMQVEAEVSSYYPDSAYDGAVVELSVNGGSFEQVTTAPEYTKTFRYATNVPMPGQPCYSGSDAAAWKTVTVDLSAYEDDDIQIRFRFGSDGGVGDEGWYVDDVLVQGIGSIVLSAPDDLTIYLDDTGTNLVYRWSDTGAPEYQLYSSTSSEGPFETLEGATAGTSLTLPIPEGDVLFYVVVASDGN